MWPRVIIIAAATLACVTRSAAGIITELGDAGNMPNTAQSTIGVSSLDAISGTLSSYQDADMFLIRIFDPATFSATTDSADTTAWDTQLFLFDAAGMGLVANDDIGNGVGPYNPRSVLVAGSGLNPTAPGLYYLAVSGWDRDPHSSGGAIFTDDTYYTGSVGPLGPGGTQPISGWDGDGSLNGGLGSYTITLSGAQFSAVPEPTAALLLIIAGVAAMPYWRRLRPARQVAT